jgi:hypothetical protein
MGGESNLIEELKEVLEAAAFRVIEASIKILEAIL